jgi:hypothetical protein
MRHIHKHQLVREARLGPFPVHDGDQPLVHVLRQHSSPRSWVPVRVHEEVLKALRAPPPHESKVGDHRLDRKDRRDENSPILAMVQAIVVFDSSTLHSNLCQPPLHHR